MRKMLTVFALTTQLGCISGSEHKKKSLLNYVNGDHVDAQGGVQIRAKNTVLKGKLALQFDSYSVPPSCTIGLFRNDEIIFKTTSTRAGTFEIETNLENGQYVISVLDERYSGSLKLRISDYYHNNLILNISKNLDNDT